MIRRYVAPCRQPASGSAFPFIPALLLAAFALPPLPVTAATLSFGEVTRLALQTHPTVLSKEFLSAAARDAVDAASWGRYPTPTVEAGNDTNGVITTTLRVQQPIYNFGRVTSEINAAQARREAADSGVEEARENIASKVIAAYVDALQQQERKEAAAQEAETLESLLMLIKRRVEAEASPRIDLDLAQSRLYQANNNLAQAKRALGGALTRLSQLAGKTIDGVIARDAGSGGPRTMAEAQEQARNFSATLRRLAHEEDAAGSDAETRKARYLPQLSARYENSYASASVNGASPYSTKRVYLVIQSETGAGLSAASEIHAARAQQEAARQEKESALRDLDERVANDWETLVAARSMLGNSRLASASSKQIYQSYSRLYTAGKKTWLDVLNAVRDATQADLAESDARAQALGAELRLRLATGQLKEMTNEK